MEAFVAQLIVLLLIVLSFAFMIGGRRGGIAALGCLLAPLQSCLKSVAGVVVALVAVLVLTAMAWNALQQGLAGLMPGGGDGGSAGKLPSLPRPGPKVPLPVHFDYPVGDNDSAGRRHGDGWHVSQDFADEKNPINDEKKGQHLGEDWLRKGGKGFAGELVYAIADGKVIRAEPNNSYGHVVMIKHPLAEGSDPPYVISLYGHLGSSDVVALGAEPKRGEPIGRIGAKGDNGVAKSTGIAWPEHLHFELRAPTHSHEDDWVAYGYSEDQEGILNPTDATSKGNTPGGGWIDAHR